ncbi:MAG: sulfatase-like hydrolase/transferase [Polaribacter sp.]
MKLFKVLMLLVFSISICFGCDNSSTKNKKSISKKKPNIVFLLADDMGYGELGSYGQKEIKTPFLDSLASKGLRFTDFYAGTAVCAPSRAVLMTGLHTGHVTIRGNKGNINGKWGRIPLNKSEKTLGEMLQGAGYQTAMIGKWHLGVPEDKSTWAKARGFDYAVQEQWGENEKGNKMDERMHWVNNAQDSVFYDYTKYNCLDEFRTNFALEYLDNKEKEKPFFLYMSYRTPHANEYEVRDNNLYKDKGYPEYDRQFASRITMLDQQIKMLFLKLEAKGELENTLIIFSSDNGPWSGSHRFKKNFKHSHTFFNSSAGLKGFKRDMYEGGIRVPMIAYWKDKIKANTKTNHQATFYDIMPTFAEIADTKSPNKTDGISILPKLLGKENQQEHDFLYFEIQEGRNVKGFKQATRFGKWKAIRIRDNYHTELYDLSTDLYEENDISNEHPELVQKANEILQRESVKNEHFPYSGGVFK